MNKQSTTTTINARFDEYEINTNSNTGCLLDSFALVGTTCGNIIFKRLSFIITLMGSFFLFICTRVRETPFLLTFLCFNVRYNASTLNLSNV